MCVLLRTDEVVDDSYGKQVILPLFLPLSSKAERHLYRRDHDALSVLTEIPEATLLEHRLSCVSMSRDSYGKRQGRTFLQY